MADVEAFLTRKVGPLPVWAYAAVGGVLGGLVLLNKKGASTTGTQGQVPGATPAGAPGTSPYAPSPIVITTPGNMPSSTSSGNVTTTPTPTSSATQVTAGSGVSTLQGQSVIPIYVHRPRPDGNGDFTPATTTPFGTVMTVTGAPITGTYFGQTATWLPVDLFGTNGTYFASASDVTPTGSGGMGGKGSSVKTLSGSGRVGRFSSPHAHSQWVNTTGMGGKGFSTMAKKTGIPAIRLAALNPHLRLPNNTYADGVTRLA